MHRCTDHVEGITYTDHIGVGHIKLKYGVASFDHMLFLIELKDKISTDYSVKEEEFDEIIEGHEQKINEKIREAFGLHEMKEKEIEKENDKITVNNVLEEAKIEDKNLYRGSSIFKN